MISVTQIRGAYGRSHNSYSRYRKSRLTQGVADPSTVLGTAGGFLGSKLIP